ncbi:MAG TPA: FkbM family methyltransferase [Ilumatobacter sp.]|nr:FkbM family methyltransferase [Ilumatobacter sp.]
MTVWTRRLRAGELFVDVGANAGLYTVLACEAGCDVISIEPLPDMLVQLRRNLELNSYEAKVVEAVLGDREGDATIGGVDSQRSHLGTGSLTVRMTTLDEVVGDRDLHGLKVDVEGAERLVVEGGSALFSSQRVKAVQLEWNDRSEANFAESREQLAHLLDRHGYELFRPDENGDLQPTEPTVGSDVFALPRSEMMS